MASALPVSGEIMTGSSPDASRASDRSREIDIVDADYEVLPRSGAIEGEPAVATGGPPPPRAPVPPPLEGMAMLRPAAPVRPFSVRGGPLFWAGGLAAAVAAFWVSGGHTLMRHATPFGADAGAVLSITGVTSHVDASGGKPVLFVDGEAGNDGGTVAALPPLEIRVTSDDGGVTRYTLGTSGRALAPGERFAFSSRLDIPRNGVKAVAVSFAE